MRGLKLVVLFFVATTLLAPPAFAGGWWSYLQVPGQYFGVGETITFTENEVMFDTIEEADAARSEAFGVYLVESYNKQLLDDAMTRPQPDVWWQPQSTPMRVGDLKLINQDSNLMKARVSFTVPAVPPGRYALVLCSNPDCAQSLGNVIPSDVAIVDDPLLAQTARRVANESFKNEMALVRVRHRLKGMREQLSNLRTQADEQQDSGASSAPVSPTRAPEPPTPWVAYAGWFLAGLATACLFLLGRRPKPTAHQVLGEPIPDDARELVNTP